MPKTGITQCYQFPQKIQVTNLILVFLPHTQTNRRVPLNQYIFMAEDNTHVSLLPMIQTCNIIKPQWMASEAEAKVSPFLSYWAGASMGLNRFYKEISNNLEPEEKLRPVLKAPAKHLCISKHVLAMEKQENPVLTWQLMTLFIFYNPTQQTSASMSIQLP